MVNFDDSSESSSQSSEKINKIYGQFKLSPVKPSQAQNFDNDPKMAIQKNKNKYTSSEDESSEDL